MRKNGTRMWVFISAVGLAVVIPLVVFAWLYIPFLNPYSGVHSELDVGFDTAVLAANEQWEDYRFRDLVPFDWDTVSVFSEGTSAGKIFDTTGVRILRGTKSYYGSGVLMVFCLDGRVVDVHDYPFHGFGVVRETFSNAVVVNGGSFREPSDVLIEADCR